MSWSSPVRVLGVCGVWLAIQTGCGGNPTVSNNDKGTNGGTANGGTDSSGNAGKVMINTGGDNGNEGGGSDQPTKYVCGNSELEPGEFCDDGNTADGDGCSGDCTTVDSNYDCSTVGQDCVKVVICGDGVLEGDEACDDKNTKDGDGCSADCSTVEDGFACVRPGTACVTIPVCGNGVRERGEECDDMNATPNDGCDDKCQLEPRFYCPTPGVACKAVVCGNAVVDPGEQCDDGPGTGDAPGTPVAGDGCGVTCQIEAGFRCNASGCQAICGDGVVVTGEGCDDGNRDGGDGCSGGCAKEPFYSCTGQPSTCTSSITCGNGVVEPGEVCDPPGVNGCKAGCKSFNLQTTPAVCNDGTIEDGEGCEPPDVGNGCSATCQVESGWTCPQPGFCFKNPFCGDSIVQIAQGEACDPPNVGNGCSATCKVEAGWTCVGLGPSTCVKPVCGNSVVEPGEQCDDGTNTATQDGCSGCAIGVGWSCPTPGAACLPKCGDGKKVGIEECDDGNKVSGDGCNTGCKVEAGFSCPTPGAKCVAAVCGDGNVNAGEGCDDGGTCVGGSKVGTPCKANATCTGGGTCIPVAGDGCGPTCQPEPTVTPATKPGDPDPKKDDPKVNVYCGDGLVLTAQGEVCDDGNNTDGDGCEHDCTITPGWDCAVNPVTPPASLQMVMNYRDFLSANSTAVGGHPDFQYNTYSQVPGITGAACTSANAATCGRLDTEGKPVLIRTGQQDNAGNGTGTGIFSADTFSLWYRDSNPNNVVGYNGIIKMDPLTPAALAAQMPAKLPKTLTLKATPAGSQIYTYDSNGAFFPIAPAEGLGNIGNEVPACGGGVLNEKNNCNGCDATCLARDYGFTSELRYFFQYQGNGTERLSFTGDDDVWVYVNGKLAVDLGGLHSALSSQVVLGDDGNGVAAEDSNCSLASLPDPTVVGGCLTPAEKADGTDQRFNLTRGGVYEIVLFHAERHSSGSNFKLTLANFLAPRSSCGPHCGDGMVVGQEYCDDGVNNSDTKAGACNTSCTARNYCGDGVQQSIAGPLASEACDDGSNITLYKNPPTGGACAPGCKAPANCGDGTLQAGQGELCDLGTAKNTGAYGGCTASCKLGGYCGDGSVNGAEVCDLGANNGKTYGSASCGYDCKPGPHCGDGIPNDLSEECDKGALNGQAGSGCDANCKDIPGCGDGKLQSNLGEQCDYGQFASNAYGGCTNMCMTGPHCGDANIDKPYEECDDGLNNNDATYDGCSKKCALGPHCGDATLQAANGELCDNGFNDDDYMYTASSCGMDCMLPPKCGDGAVQAAHELCDAGANNSDTAYDGCTTKCDFGPYCGDGDVQGPELCDDGVANVAYAAQKGGCGYDCQPAPYCGDGTRNGSEQCDLGTAANTGDYGTCNADCTFAPRCGDRKTQGTEQCDDGPTGSLSCTPTCKRRVVVQ